MAFMLHLMGNESARKAMRVTPICRFPEGKKIAAILLSLTAQQVSVAQVFVQILVALNFHGFHTPQEKSISCVLLRRRLTLPEFKFQ